MPGLPLLMPTTPNCHRLHNHTKALGNIALNMTEGVLYLRYHGDLAANVAHRNWSTNRKRGPHALG